MGEWKLVDHLFSWDNLWFLTRSVVPPRSGFGVGTGVDPRSPSRPAGSLSCLPHPLLQLGCFIVCWVDEPWSLGGVRLPLSVVVCFEKGMSGRTKLYLSSWKVPLGWMVVPKPVSIPERIVSGAGREGQKLKFHWCRPSHLSLLCCDWFNCSSRNLRFHFWTWKTCVMCVLSQILDLSFQGTLVCLSFAPSPGVPVLCSSAMF